VIAVTAVCWPWRSGRDHLHGPADAVLARSDKPHSDAAEGLSLADTGRDFDFGNEARVSFSRRTITER
jgi:hypothetical protein